MANTLITGATGLVGRRLVQRFENVCITTRDPESARRLLGSKINGAVTWKSTAEPLQLNDHGPFDAIINLIGEPIAGGRWTKEKKKRIRDSRVVGTRNLVDAVRSLDKLPEVMVSVSAVGYYGDRGDSQVTESAGVGQGFLPEVCNEWEQAARQIEELGVRLVIIRTGIVMAKEGGALAQMLPIFNFGLGGRLGNGQQYFPWIHLNDLCSLIHWAVMNESTRGVYNATSPNPITNQEFTKSLAATLGRPAIIPAPRFALKIALGEFADSLLYSQRIVPAAAIRDGFKFEYSDIGHALSDLLR